MTHISISSHHLNSGMSLQTEKVQLKLKVKIKLEYSLISKWFNSLNRTITGIEWLHLNEKKVKIKKDVVIKITIL